jgi:hypothetical protein
VNSKSNTPNNHNFIDLSGNKNDVSVQYSSKQSKDSNSNESDHNYADSLLNSKVKNNDKANLDYITDLKRQTSSKQLE